jgi:hypothetical protein
MESGLVKVVLFDAKGGGTYESISYTVFADGRLEMALTEGSTVDFGLDWMDVRFVPR